MKDKALYEEKVKGTSAYLSSLDIRWLFLLHRKTHIRTSEYCERYAKKQNGENSVSDGSDEEVSDNEAYSDGRSESDDEVAGHADP